MQQQIQAQLQVIQQQQQLAASLRGDQQQLDTTNRPTNQIQTIESSRSRARPIREQSPAVEQEPHQKLLVERAASLLSSKASKDLSLSSKSADRDGDETEEDENDDGLNSNSSSASSTNNNISLDSKRRHQTDEEHDGQRLRPSKRQARLLGTSSGNNNDINSKNNQDTNLNGSATHRARNDFDSGDEVLEEDEDEDDEAAADDTLRESFERISSGASMKSMNDLRSARRSLDASVFTNTRDTNDQKSAMRSVTPPAGKAIDETEGLAR